MKIIKPYYLILFIVFSCSSDSSNETQEEPKEDLSVDFDTSAKKIDINGSVNFTDLSKGEVVTREWSFPGGDPSTSNIESPTVIYKNAGIFDVSLKVKSANGEASEVKNGFIEVLEEVEIGPIPDDYVLRMDFDSDVTDKSIHNNPTEAINFAYASDRFDIENSAGAFLAANESSIKVPHSSSINLNKEMTIALWFYYEEQQNGWFYTLLEKTNPDAGGHSRYGMWVHGGGIIQICIEPDTCPQSLCQECLNAGEPLNLNSWNHLVGTFDGSSLKVYINGVESSSKNIGTSGISQTPYELFIGTDPYDSNPNFLTGRVDNLRLYNRALSNSEIQSLYEE